MSVRIPLQTIVRRSLPFILLVAMLGQPNGFFLYLPLYPILALALLLVFTVLVVASKLQGRSFAWPHTNLGRALTLYLGLSFLSLIYAPDPVLGFRLLFSVLFKVVIFYTLVDLCQNRAVLQSVLKCIIGLSVLFAVQGLSQIVAVAGFNYPVSADFNSTSQLNDSSIDFGVISYGIFGLSRQTFDFGNIYIPRCQAIFLEPGFYSNFLELTLFASLAYFALFPPVRRWIPTMVMGVQIAALLMTFSPIGILAGCLGTLVYLLFTFRDRPRVYMRHARNIVLAVMILCGIGMITFPDVVSRVYEVVVVSKFISDHDGLSSGDDRARLFNMGVNLFVERPLLGWGSNQTRVVGNTEITNNALLTAATELGLVGLCLYLALLGCIAITIIQNYRLSRHIGSPGLRGFAGATAASAIAMIFHTMFIETQWTFYYWIAMAILYICHRILIQVLQQNGLTTATQPGT